ncbi:MAG: livF [Solirubrobacterales bacterium]|nr:livF [Solirubrobacterales bacterium]
MTALLECRALEAGYLGRPVVRDFDLALRPGTVTALLGPNGAGKTTVLLTLAGIIPGIGGSIEMGGASVWRSGPRALTKRGLVLVPDDRWLFTALTTRENLTLARRKNGLSVRDVLEYFPSLVKRLDVAAGKLSGGEQQMLATARALIQEPKVLLIDEMSMGLAPVLVEQLMPIVRRVATDTGAAVLLVEQHVKLALQIADEAVVLTHGELALRGPAADLLRDPARLERAYLSKTHAS